MRASRGGERWRPSLGLDQKGPPRLLRLPTNARRCGGTERDGKIYLRAAGTQAAPFVAGRGEKFAFFAIFSLCAQRSLRRIFFAVLLLPRSRFLHECGIEGIEVADCS